MKRLIVVLSILAVAMAGCGGGGGGGTDPTTYTITASAGAGGAISPSGATTVNAGASQTFTITPNTNFIVANVVVDGVSKGALATYTFTGVAANHTITATFTAATGNTFTVTASAGTGGTITPSGSVVVNSGTTKVFAIAADTGYIIQDVVVDSVSQGPVTSYTFNGILASHTIAATFTKVTLTVPAGAAPAGVTPTATAKASADMPSQPVGPAFIAGAQVSPANTTFSSQVTLTFTLDTPVEAGATLQLAQFDGTNWITYIPVTTPVVSSDRLTVTVSISKFSAGGYFAIWKV